MRDAGGGLYDLGSYAPSVQIRVFNSDFVKENLSFDSAKANAVLLLGAEDIAKQRELDDLRIQLADLRSQLKDREATQSKEQSDVDRLLTRCARDTIKNPLSIPNFDKTKLEQLLKQVSSNAHSHILSEEQYEAELTVYRSTVKNALPVRVFSLASVEQLYEKARQLLGRAVGLKQDLPELAGNFVLEQWLDLGRSLHRDSANCHFCGSALPASRLAQLSDYFSSEYDALMRDIEILLNEIDAALAQTVRLDDEASFYSDLAERYSAARIEIEKQTDLRREFLSSLKLQLEAKRTKAFASLECSGVPVVGDLSKCLGAALAAVNALIEEHNARTSGFEAVRKAAQQELLLHNAAIFERDEHYSQRLQVIANMKCSLGTDRTQAQKLEDGIRQIEVALSEPQKGAARLNELLAAYFGKTDIQIEVTADKQFQISRSGVPAKNLSEGEQTAIGFAYFITRVQDGTSKVEDQIVVVDDPISSLDAGHVFNTYALVKTQLGGAKQLFIFTHNFEFYNLVREWLADDEGRKYTDKPRDKWKKWAAYIVQKNDAGVSSIGALPKELLKFKSEYHYLFSRLHEFDQDGGKDFEQLLSLPNLVRRFMEAFGGIMIPTHQGLQAKMARLFADEVERERVWKFINHYSHQTSITRSLTIPDTSECTSVVRACLGAVESWNSMYYQDLVSEVSSMAAPA